MAMVLKKIAVINVRKLPGYKRTWDYSRISNAYNQYKDVLLLQIETYKPDIIIGGSTIHLFKNDLSFGEYKTKGSVEYWMTKSKIYIAAYHPGQTQVIRQKYVNDIIGVAKMWDDWKNQSN